MNSNNIKFKQGALRAGLCLVMLSGTCTMSVQAQSDNTPEPVSAVRANASKYVMKEISGHVYDAATKQPLSGVRVKALNNGRYMAMTDEKGAYTIKVPEFVTSLYFSTDDYNGVQKPIKGATGQDVSLYSSQLKGLYTDGTQLLVSRTMKEENTSAVTIENDIENYMNGSVRTINRGGLPAQGAAMFVNGINSLNATSQPLVIVDGVMWDMQYDRTTLHDGFVNNVLNILDPNDVASVELIRNGTALYGARGANGVLVIKTKRGQSMATRITARIYGGFETRPELNQLMNADQYRSYVTEFLGTTPNAEYISGATSVPFMNEDKSYLFYNMYHNNTDWQEDLYKNAAFTQNYKVSVEGGDEVAMYNLSLGYTKSDATAKTNDFNRLNIRFNTDVKMFDRLTAAIDLSYARNAYNLRDNGWGEDYSARNISSPNVLGQIQAPFLSPFAYYVVYDEAMQGLNLIHAKNQGIYAGKDYSEANNPLAFATQFGYAGLVNPYWILQNGQGDNKNFQEQTQFTINVEPRYEINKYLTVSNRFSYILTRANEKYYLPYSGTPMLSVEGLGGVQSVISTQFSKGTTIFNDFRVNWDRNYGAHSIDLTGGFRISSYSYSDSRMTGYNNSNDKMPNMRSDLQYKNYGGTNDRWNSISYYVDANYDYRNLYFLKATVSMDASSRFGKDASAGIGLFGVRWGLFPSLQAGWLMSSEEWFDVPAINYLKITAGYDESGNDNVDYYATRTYFENVKFLDKATALELANIANPTIQWETTRRFNIGLQTSLLNNRLALGVDYFWSKTSDLLTRKTVSDITGLPFMWTNDGSLKNTGVEVNLHGVLINTADWKWQAGFSMGHYKNEITDLAETNLNELTTYALLENGQRDMASEKTIQGYTTSVYGNNNILTAVGSSAGVFYGYKTAGVFATDAEAAAAGKYGYLRYPTGLTEQPYRNFQAGDVHFVDQNGDGWISDADMVEIGNPNPTLFGNIYTSVSWKRLKLDVNFKYSLGNDVFNYQRSQLEAANNIWNQTTAVVNRWRYDGHQTDVPRAMAATSDYWVNNERFSDRWIEDGSYLKLKKVRLTYSIPLTLSWLQGLTVWGEANNLFTVSKYLGADPEVSCGNGVLYQGIDAGYLPQSRNFNLGVTINL